MDSKMNERKGGGTHENVENWETELPPFSTFLNKRPLDREMSTRRCDGGVRSQTVPPGPQVPGMEQPAYGGQMVPIQVSQGLDVPPTGAGGQLLKLHPDLTASSKLGGPSSVISFTIPPTEEDVRQMQSVQGKNGHIKRPMNAFMVWSRIHRHALRKACPDTTMTDTSILLGSEWSKLTTEQKRPYYEVAHRLNAMHKQQFPDYEFRPQKKKVRECSSLDQGAGAAPCVSSTVFQTAPRAPSMFLAPTMHSYPTVISYPMGHYPYPSFCPYHARGLYSSVQSHFSRFPYTISPAVDVRNYQSTHIQGSETVQTTVHYPAGASQEVVIGSTTTSVCLNQPDIVPSNKVECKYSYDVDVVTLEDI